MLRQSTTLASILAACLLAGCAQDQDSIHPVILAETPTPEPATRPAPTSRPVFTSRPGQRLERQGDEIMVCGQLFHTGAPVVLWVDPGGYDAYRLEKRFDESPAATQPAVGRSRFNSRDLTPAELHRVYMAGWDLDLLREKVDQFVIHYDVCGTSRLCFGVLHDDRHLSVHFLLDLDGTIYQTLDLKERAWHATISNGRSIGIEIANLGAYTSRETDRFKDWYGKDADGNTRVTIPPRLGDGGIRSPEFVPRPARDKLVFGAIQGHRRRQYDFTPEQYASLIKLSATLCTVFPRLACDYPKDADGMLIPQKLSDEQLANYHGLLGHYHVQSDKVDPGPAFQWDKVIQGARALMTQPPPPATQPAQPDPATRPADDDDI